MNRSLYWLVFGITNTILTILWIISLKQCCNSDISDKKRSHRTMSVVLFSCCALSLNMFYYLSLMYPNFTLIFDGLNLPIITFIFEAIVTIIGFHIFCLFHISFVHRLYNATNENPPSFIKCIFIALEICVIIMILICYSLVIILDKLTPIIIFYILYAIIILCQSILVLYETSKILKLLTPTNVYIEGTSIRKSTHRSSVIHRKSENESVLSTKLLSAKRTMKTAISILLLICFVCICDILLNLHLITQGISSQIGNIDIDLMGNILRSLFMITLMMILVFWIYQRNATWCNCNSNSICIFIIKCSKCTHLKHFKYYMNTNNINELNNNISPNNNDDKNINLLDTPTPFANLTMNTYTMIWDSTPVHTPIHTPNQSRDNNCDDDTTAIDTDAITTITTTATTTLLIGDDSSEI
eukprot:340107_1